ncbi:helix-turn-helix domain-containing protein [Leucothrix mucor]|uniref:helix-turn-helix domain-containing protein n=1 Tax=Leucothrix mucor TaxID=45248 RepID=UPI0003B3B2F9|nr:helix-turn-helix transcriptional regulator [Leucothrix mucor]
MDKRYNPLPPFEEIAMRKELLGEIREQPGMPLMSTLRTLRTRTRLTVAEYSKMTGVATRTIQNIEAGRVSPTIKTADKLLKPFGLVMGVCSILCIESVTKSNAQ